MKLTLYGDESGSITTCDAEEVKYFYIGMISTDMKSKVKRVFRTAKMNYIKSHQMNLDYTKEIKGSEMTLGMKEYILSELIRKTDIKFYFIVADNHYLRKVLRENPHITFNYLIGIFIKQHFKTDISDLNLLLDNRNKAVNKLKDLEHYLQTELIVHTEIKSVKVEYLDSDKHDLIQIADVFNNLLYGYGSKCNKVLNGKSMKKFKRICSLLETVQERTECITVFPQPSSDFKWIVG